MEKPHKRTTRVLAAGFLSMGVLVAGLLTTTPVNATMERDGDTHHHCDYVDDLGIRQWAGCFDSTSVLVDETSGATAANGLPIRPGDVLALSYSVTNNSDITLKDLELYGTTPVDALSCGQEECVPGDQTTPGFYEKYGVIYAGKSASSNAIQYGFDATSGLLKYHAQYWGFSPGETAAFGYKIQVPLNAPTGMRFGNRFGVFDNYPNEWERYALLSAGFVTVDAAEVQVTTNGDGFALPTSPITGTAEAGASLTVRDVSSGDVICTTSANGAGKWSCTTAPLAVGTHSLRVDSVAAPDGFESYGTVEITVVDALPVPGLGIPWALWVLALLVFLLGRRARMRSV